MSTAAQATLICKVCDRGELIHKRVFRLSGPAVTIGFILLIPSILGMVVSAVMFIGFVGGNESGHQAARQFPLNQSSDNQFRRECVSRIKEVAKKFDVPEMEQRCECAIEAAKNGEAPHDCDDVDYSRYYLISKDVQRIYDSLMLESSVTVNNTIEKPQKNEFEQALNALGAGFAIFLGISSFVGGLLGWLLVMRKSVLQCSLCGAVISAS